MVAIFAITNNINEFSICIQNGVPQAGTAMLGICYGEKDDHACKQILKLQLTIGIFFSAVFSISAVLFSGQIGRLFGSQLDVRSAVTGLALSLIPAVCNSIMTYYYYSIMEAAMANFITFFRIFGAMVLMAWVLAPYKDFIWLFYPAGELTTAALWMPAACILNRKKWGRAGLYLLDETADQEGRCINFTVPCNAAKICEAGERISDFCNSNGFSQKQSMTINLALEELMIIVAEKSMNNKGTLDVRLVRTQEGGILRIRSQGKHFNPLKFAQNDMEYMGVAMIMRMARHTEYQTTLGLNTLLVVI